MKWADIKYTLSGDSITVIVKGNTHTIPKSMPNFKALRTALIEEDPDKVEASLSVEKVITEWAKGKFKLTDGVVEYEGKPLPDKLTNRILQTAAKGESVQPLLYFWERLKKNPSWRSVNQLFDFLVHENIPLTKDGKFLAYKAVNSDYTDVHSGRVNNTPGTVNKMDRNLVSDDPNHACHYGFHVGAIEYAKSFSPSDGKILICEVDPENVVCVPHDARQQKMRVCEYLVKGHMGTELSSTNHEEDEPDIGDGTEEKEDYKVTEKPEPKAKKEKEKPAEKIFKPAAKWNKFTKMGMKELMEQSIEDLRRYAGHGLAIVGASKIPGGKTALVTKIMNVRA